MNARLPIHPDTLPPQAAPHADWRAALRLLAAAALFGAIVGSVGTAF